MLLDWHKVAVETILMGRSLVTQRQTSIECQQPRPSSEPPSASTDLVGFISSHISETCLILANNTGTLSSNRTFDLLGYELLIYDPLELFDGNITTCGTAFNQIVNNCVAHDVFYGGNTYLHSIFFNLTNTVAPGTPLNNTLNTTTSTTLVPILTIAPGVTSTSSSYSSTTTIFGGPLLAGPTKTAADLAALIAAATVASSALASAPLDTALAAAALATTYAALQGMVKMFPLEWLC